MFIRQISKAVLPKFLILIESSETARCLSMRLHGFQMKKAVPHMVAC